MKQSTICVHGVDTKHDDTGAISVPIYQSATFEHPSAGKSTGFDYVRTSNPTRVALEQIMATNNPSEIKFLEAWSIKTSQKH